LRDIDPEVSTAYGGAIDRLEALGAEIAEFSLGEPFEDFVERNGIFIGYEGWRRHGVRINAAPERMNPEVLARFRAGETIAAGDYHVAVLKRDQARMEMAQRMASFDAVLTPTTPIAAIPREDVDEDTLLLTRYTRAVNYFGLCALAVPAALTAGGLPLSVQFIGGPDTEGRILQIGHAFEQARGAFPAPDLSGFKSE
jgi:aspartyl-tRNA(Asn)/glutamyl-tRNA(Gln) amidotransferase subunit A